MAEDQAISIALVGFEFFLIYLANSLNMRDDRNNPVKMMVFIRMFLITISIFTSFISVVYVQGLADATAILPQSQNPLNVWYQYVLMAFIFIGALIMLYIVYLGIMMMYTKIREAIGRT